MSNERNVSLRRATEQQKQAFELEIRMYSGDDPLDVWDRYIKWIEHSYAKNDEGNNLCAVLERAVQQFVEEKRFCDDPRYVDMWIKLAQNSTEPLNIFSYMQTEGIGVQQAAFYSAWSDALEMQGDLQQAAIIFLEGLKCGARPLDELQRHYRAFQSRLPGQAAGHGADVTQEKQDIELQLPSSVGRRPRRNRRVLASVNGEEGSAAAGHSSTLDYQPSTSGLDQSTSVSDGRQARSAEPAVVDAKENQFVSQRTEKMMCCPGDAVPEPGPGTTQTQTMEEAPHTSSKTALLAKEQGPEANQSKDQPGVQVMYCRELLFRGPMELCFEELRAERYFASMRQTLQEKQDYLNKEKERLRLQIEQKMSVRSTLSEENIQENGKPFEVYSESHKPSTEARPSGPNADVCPAVQPKPFAVFDENSACGLPHHVLSAAAVGPAQHRSLKLPAPALRKTRTPAHPATERVSTPTCPATERESTDGSLSHAEEVVSSQRNQTLSGSPDDTYDFAHAAMLASTPFAAGRGRGASAPGDGGVTEGLRGVPQKCCPDAMAQPPAEPADTSKLSPILEVSQELSSASALSQRHPRSAGAASSASIVMDPIPDEAEDDMEQEPPAPPDDQPVDPCSPEVRRRLLRDVDLHSLPNLQSEPAALPRHILGLRLGGLMLSPLTEMSNLENYYYLQPEEHSVVVKMERCPVPWDFYICSQLKARLPADTEDHFLNESSCFLFEDGCVTLWRVPPIETTLAECVAGEEVNEHLVAHLALRLLEMVRRMHTCHLVHGALRPHTLIFYPSSTPSDPEHGVVMAIDFSSSLDLKLQPEVQSVGSLDSAADFIRQGLLSPTSSPYQLDLMGVAETVHLMLFKRRLEVVQAEAGWRLVESEQTSEGTLHPVWHEFFQKILNHGERSAMAVLNELHEDLSNYTEDVVQTLII